MKKMRVFFLFCSFVLAFLVLNCDHLLPRACSQEVVTFIVPVSVGMFSQDAVIRVRLWDEEQLETSENTSGCTVSYNVQTKTEDVRCPQGVEYAQVMPEEFMFDVGDINSNIEITSAAVRVGEKYRLLISGKSKDNCNTTSAEVREVADSETIVIERLSWSTTAMGCIGIIE